MAGCRLRAVCLLSIFVCLFIGQSDISISTNINIYIFSFSCMHNYIILLLCITLCSSVVRVELASERCERLQRMTIACRQRTSAIKYSHLLHICIWLRLLAFGSMLFAVPTQTNERLIPPVIRCELPLRNLC